MSEKRHTFKLHAGAATVFVVGVVVCVVSPHMCVRESLVIEIPLYATLLAGCALWTGLAKTPSQAWTRVVLSLVLSLMIEEAYTAWLHSPSFPEALLSQRARTRLRAVEQMKQQRDSVQQEAPEEKDDESCGDQ